MHVRVWGQLCHCLSPLETGSYICTAPLSAIFSCERNIRDVTRKNRCRRACGRKALRSKRREIKTLRTGGGRPSGLTFLACAAFVRCNLTRTRSRTLRCTCACSRGTRCARPGSTSTRSCSRSHPSLRRPRSHDATMNFISHFSYSLVLPRFTMPRVLPQRSRVSIQLRLPSSSFSLRRSLKTWPVQARRCTGGLGGSEPRTAHVNTRHMLRPGPTTDESPIGAPKQKHQRFTDGVDMADRRWHRNIWS